MLALQVVLLCLLYIFMVKVAVKNDGLNCLYFYPEEYIDAAVKRGLADRDEVAKRSKRFMIPFCIILFVAVIAIIAVWNGVADFKTAYFQSCVLLVNVNWFDGIVIDELWVRNSKIWRIKGMEDMLFAKPIGFMLKRRILGTIMYFIISLMIAGIVVLIGKI